MAIKITMKADSGKVTSTEVKVVGVEGEACMLQTELLRRFNPAAKVEETEEMFLRGGDNETYVQVR